MAPGPGIGSLAVPARSWLHARECAQCTAVAYRRWPLRDPQISPAPLDSSSIARRRAELSFDSISFRARSLVQHQLERATRECPFKLEVPMKSNAGRSEWKNYVMPILMFGLPLLLLLACEYVLPS